jgi:hypothetical protein
LEKVKLHEIDVLLVDEVEVQEDEENDNETEEQEIVEEDEDVQEVALAVEEESEVQEVVDLGSYTFRFCTCPILNPVTDSIPSDRVVLALPVVKCIWKYESPTIESCPPPDAGEYAVRKA